MSGNKKNQTIDALTHKLAELKEERRRYCENTDEHAEKRDKLNERVGILREEIEKLRTTRDDLNEQVRRLKQQRNETISKIREKMGVSKTISQERRTIAENKPSRSYPSLKRELEDVEWMVQTTSHTLQEDKEMMEQVKQLETQLSVYRKMEKASQKTSELRSQIETFKNENETCHKKLIALAQRSQELHKGMLEKFAEMKMKRKQADEMHKQFLEARVKTKTIQNEIDEITAQLLQLKKSMQETEQKQRKESEDTIREAIEKQAKEKLRRKEKLTWEEFQILAEKGMTSQD